MKARNDTSNVGFVYVFSIDRSIPFVDTFSYDCINGWLNQYNDSCPECRSYLGMDYNSKPFKDSYTLKSFINKLIIKCDFVDKGCEVVFELELLLKHLEECNYNICESCGYKMGKKEDHNCIELLKAENNNLKNENMKLRQQLTGQTIEIRSDITTNDN